MRSKNATVGTKVRSHDGMEGTIVQNRKTMPDMDSRFDYGVEVDLGETGAQTWGYAAEELTAL